MSMRTSKPISTISYNSKEFLIAKLNQWHSEHRIAYWCIICHVGEILDDGTKEKDHYHVYIEPNGQVDTMSLQEDTKELDLKNNKPLKCIDFRSSNNDDWTWYCLHDPQYLARKGECRQYTYTRDDFISCDADEFDARFYRAMHCERIVQDNRLAQYIQNGFSLGQLTYLGVIPMTKAIQAKEWYKLYKSGEKEEKRKNDPLVKYDDDTGMLQTILFDEPRNEP